VTLDTNLEDLAPWIMEGRAPSDEEAYQYLQDAIARSLSAKPMTREQIAESCLDSVRGFLESLPCKVLTNETPISAGWLRECGIPIPESIPDCATVPRSAMRMEMVGSSASGGVMTAQMQVTFSEAFKWVEATVTVDDDHDGSEI
jgi:hypothetical protein